jgi:hypothetical protein
MRRKYMIKIAGLLIMVLVSGIMTAGNVSAETQINDNLSVNGSVRANAFYGEGSGLTSVPGSALAGTTITVDQLADNAVTTDKLAADAVTRAKIAFYSRVVIVAKEGGDYDNPATAMGANGTWCPDRSATSPCLLKIMPGVYDVGSSAVQMQQYIDIVGSGEKTTKITGINGTGVLQGANNAELQFLTIENTGGNANSRAIYNSSKSPVIFHVTAMASGATTNNVAVYNTNSSPVMANVTASASATVGTGGYGVVNTSSSLPAMTNVTASATGGTSGYGVYNHLSSPALNNVIASASGAINNYGIYNTTASPSIVNASATGSGGTFSYGIYNTSSSSPTMINVTATASGGSNNRAVNNSGSSPTMTHVTATASGGTNNRGVDNQTSGTVTINHSVITGSTYSIYNDAGVTTLVGSSLLDGNTKNTGTITCAGVYDTSYTFLPSTCPE